MAVAHRWVPALCDAWGVQRDVVHSVTVPIVAAAKGTDRRPIDRVTELKGKVAEIVRKQAVAMVTDAKRDAKVVPAWDAVPVVQIWVDPAHVVLKVAVLAEVSVSSIQASI